MNCPVCGGPCHTHQEDMGQHGIIREWVCPECLWCESDCEEDVQDAISARQAIAEAERDGTTPWDQIKAELGLEGQP